MPFTQHPRNCCGCRCSPFAWAPAGTSGPFPGSWQGALAGPAEREPKRVGNARAGPLLPSAPRSPRGVPSVPSAQVGLGAVLSGAAAGAALGRWPPRLSPHLFPLREVSCPFGRMGEMEKAPPLPSANTAPLSSHPAEPNGQVPAGTVTSPPGNAFPRPAGKGASVSLKEPPGFPHPKPFPAVSILTGAGGCRERFQLRGEGELLFSHGALRLGHEAGGAPVLGGTSCAGANPEVARGDGVSTLLRSF